MPNPEKQRRPSLTRLFDRAPDPIYAIDKGRRIAYCNQGLVDWTGVSHEKLLGRLVQYHSTDDLKSLPGIAAGLCPPPSALNGIASSGHVSCINRAGKLVYRRAQYLPLGMDEKLDSGRGQENRPGQSTDESRCIGVVVFLGAHDVPSAEIAQTSRSSGRLDALHAIVRHMREEFAWHAATVLAGSSLASRRLRDQVRLAANGGGPTTIVSTDLFASRALAHGICDFGKGKEFARALTVDAATLDEENCAKLRHELLQDHDELYHIVLEHCDQIQASAAGSIVELWRTAPRRFRWILLTSPAEQDCRCPAPLEEMTNVLTMDVPSLEERRTDFPEIVQCMVEAINRDSEKQIEGVSAVALEQLLACNWRDGFARLQSVIQRAHRKCEGSEIVPSDLPEWVHHSRQSLIYARQPLQSVNLEERLTQLESDLIVEAMKRARGNKTEAADLLGITRPRLYRRLEALGMSDEQA